MAACLVLSQLIEVRVLAPELKQIKRGVALDFKIPDHIPLKPEKKRRYKETKIKEYIIKPTDSLNIVWSENRMERLLYEDELYKYCYGCHKWVQHDNFTNSSYRNDGKEVYCKPCYRESQALSKKLRAMKPILLEQQENECPICLKDLSNYHNIHVDHNHDTKEVRAALDNHCNDLLGGSKDNLENLVRACIFVESDGIMALHMEEEEKQSFRERMIRLIDQELARK